MLEHLIQFVWFSAPTVTCNKRWACKHFFFQTKTAAAMKISRELHLDYQLDDESFYLFKRSDYALVKWGVKVWTEAAYCSF